MPFVTVGDLDVRYELAGPTEAPMVVLSHSLGADLSMWDPQARALAARFRVLRYDGRGHGRTTVAPGPYSIETLARDVLALMDALGVERAHFCGLSMARCARTRTDRPPGALQHGRENRNERGLERTDPRRGKGRDGRRRVGGRRALVHARVPASLT
jgi:hypothetical protein